MKDDEQVGKAKPDMFLYAALEITVWQDEEHRFSEPDEQLMSVFDRETVPDRIDCCNPRCAGEGGIDVWALLQYMPRHTTTTFQCSGYEEPSDASGQRCENVFSVKFDGETLVR